MKKLIVYLLCLALFNSLSLTTVNGESVKNSAFLIPQQESSSTSKTVKIYEHWWYGKSAVLKIKQKKCVNLPKRLDNTITSIDTKNNCVIIFVDNNCQGRGVRLEKYSFGTDSLGRIGMNDVVSSIKLC